MNRLFYGWYVVIACGIGIACGIASVVLYTFPIFVGPLTTEFGWTRTEIFLAVLLTTAAVTVASPFFGALVDRLGARRVILAGLVLEAAVFASFAWQTENVLTFYIRYIALAILGVGTTHISFTRIISLWFDRKRGLALGIMLAGVGLGGFFWPILTQWAIDSFGWRNAYLVVAATIIALGCSALLLVVRESPRSMGLMPDGDPVPADGNTARKMASGMLLGEALRTRTFWIMLVAFLLTGFGITSLQFHLVPLLTDRGIAPMRAATVMSVLAIALVVGRIGAGWLMDRFFAPRVGIVFLVGPVVSIGLLITGVDLSRAFLAGILVGLAAGAIVDVTAYLASRYFGLRYFSSIYAWYYASFSFGAGFGPVVTANAFDRFGGYSEVLMVHGSLLVIAAILLALLPRFPKASAA